MRSYPQKKNVFVLLVLKFYKFRGYKALKTIRFFLLKLVIGPEKREIGPLTEFTKQVKLVYITCMGKTLKVAKDRAYDDTKSVIPREVGKGVHVDHAPSAQALKLMHLFVAKSGGAMAEDRWHEIRLSDIRAITGFRHHDTKSLEKLLREIRATVFSFDDPVRMKVHIGGFMDHAEVDYREEERGDLTVRWYFAKMFRDLAEKSNHWAIMDRQTVFALRSKYSILLFQWLSNFTNLEHKTSEVLSIEDVRAILGVPEGKLKTWDAMNRFALKPAIAELNQLSRHDVTATPLKRGRHIDAVKFEWEPKPDPTEAKRELGRHTTGRKARGEGRAETPTVAFPAYGGIRYSEPWQTLAKTALTQQRYVTHHRIFG